MHVEIVFTSPTYGGGGALGLVGDFLVEGLPDVGGGIESVEIDVLVRSEPRAPRRHAVDDMPDEHLAALLDLISGGEAVGPDDPEWIARHEARRSKGPMLTFRRAARRLSMRIVSDLSELDVFGAAEVTPDAFALAAREVAGALEDLPRRIKPGDDVDARTLLSHLRSRLEGLPVTRDELDRAVERLVGAAQRRRDAMDEWERLEVDWTTFAADARERFDDPFFFDPGDEEAPHGNDAGADLLAAYLTDRPDDGLDFLEAQVREMGYASLSALGDIDLAEHDAMVIAAAFADLMVRGRTSAELKQLAAQALHRRQARAPSPRNAQLRDVLD